MLWSIQANSKISTYTHTHIRGLLLRPNQFEALAGVEHRRRKPGQFESAEEAQTHVANPEHVQRNAPVCQLHYRICPAGKIEPPVLSDITSCRQVKLVVAPVSGEAVDGLERSAMLGPAHAAVRVAVELHPVGGEISDLRQVLELYIHRVHQRSPLYGYINLLHSAHLIHPRQRVLRVEHDDETRAVTVVLLLPHLHDLRQMQRFAT